MSENRLLRMKNIIADIDFVKPEDKIQTDTIRITEESHSGSRRKLYIESYGCQMNFADSEIVISVMAEMGYDTTSDFHTADVVFLNTCSIREQAEQKVRTRLEHINAAKRKRPEMIMGVLGCMAERLKTTFLEEEKVIDMVVGPDSYRDLPNLLQEVEDGQKAVNVFLSRDETYADITPVRLNSNGISAFVSIMRGCDNMCSFCVVPFTRGRERSRDAHSIIKEAQDLFSQGYRDVTLLGQNVDSYEWKSEDKTEEVNFAQLLELVAKIDPALRVRFSTSHPKDITDEVLHTIARYPNICKAIHLPAQSGNSRVLQIMNRTYNREWYLERVDAIKRIIGEECSITSDLITGFCSETEEEHMETISLIEQVRFDTSYMYAYSDRPGTLAHKKYADDIPAAVKQRRLTEIIEVQNRISRENNEQLLGKIFSVLVDGTSGKSDQELSGKSSQYKTVVFPKENYKKGDYVNVRITSSTQNTLRGEAIGYTF